MRRLVRQLVGALCYLHARSIAHRDIKLENVLLDEWCNCKLIDFGFAILSRGKLRVPCGSPVYTAPEILLAHEYDGQLADVWSLGVLIYVMLAGRFPFQGATRAELSRNVLRGSFASPQGLSREPESLLRRVLVLDPHQRYTIDNVRAHPWMHRRASEGEIITEHTATARSTARAATRSWRWGCLRRRWMRLSTRSGTTTSTRPTCCYSGGSRGTTPRGQHMGPPPLRRPSCPAMPTTATRPTPRPPATRTTRARPTTTRVQQPALNERIEPDGPPAAAAPTAQAPAGPATMAAAAKGGGTLPRTSCYSGAAASGRLGMEYGYSYGVYDGGGGGDGGGFGGGGGGDLLS